MSKDKTLTANLTDIFVEEVHNDSHVGKRLPNYNKKYLL